MNFFLRLSYHGMYKREINTRFDKRYVFNWVVFPLNLNLRETNSIVIIFWFKKRITQLSKPFFKRKSSLSVWFSLKSMIWSECGYIPRITVISLNNIDVDCSNEFQIFDTHSETHKQSDHWAGNIYFFLLCGD